MKEVNIVVSGGTILSFDEQGSRIEKGALAIDGNEIIAVGKAEEIHNKFIGKKTIDTSGCLVIPGLINCHTHAAMTCFRGIADDLKLEDWLNNYIFPAEARNVDKDLAYWGSMLACAEMIKSGTTTFCDMYIFEDETARAAHDAGMRCLVGEVLFDFPSPNSQTPEGGLKYTRMLIEKWMDDSLVNIAVEPHSLYTCSPELLNKAKTLADEYQLPIATHLLETEIEREGIKKKLGKDASTFLKEIGYLNDRFIAFHCVAIAEDDIKLFADHGCACVHNPESNMKLASGVAPVPEMIDAGITVGLGTDGCASNNNLDMFQEMDMAAKLHKVQRLDPTVMDAQTVAKAATCEGAKALGMETIVGSLKAGMKADIAIVDLNKPHLTPMYNEYSHLVYAVNGADIKTVIINGKVVMEDRTLVTINEKEAMENVIRISTKIKASLGIEGS